MIGNIVIIGFSAWQFFIALMSLLGSALALKQASKFDDWYFQGIYLALVAIKMKPEDLPIKFVSKKTEQIEPKVEENLTED